MMCKKLIYKEKDNSSEEKIKVLLGLVLEETPEFVRFKTGKGREYLVNKDVIIELKDTNIVFVEEKNEHAI